MHSVTQFWMGVLTGVFATLAFGSAFAAATDLPSATMFSQIEQEGRRDG